MKDRPTTGATTETYFAWLERNQDIAYPALALMVLGLVAWGILTALRTELLDPEVKLELKRNIINELRRNVTGASAETLGKLLRYPEDRIVRVVSEMERDGIVDTTVSERGRTLYILRGAGPKKAS